MNKQDADSLCVNCDNAKNCNMHKKDPDKRVVECEKYENEDMKKICSLVAGKWLNGRLEKYW